MAGIAMPIRPFLEGELFDPELIDAMGQALVDACKTLGLKPQQDPAVRLLAGRIITKAGDGVRDRKLLTAAALEGFGNKAAE
jgi:hypothetical protein